MTRPITKLDQSQINGLALQIILWVQLNKAIIEGKSSLPGNTSQGLKHNVLYDVCINVLGKNILHNHEAR